MPITLNGSGTVTGISAGGLPDGSITPADLSTGGPTWDSSGKVLGTNFIANGAYIGGPPQALQAMSGGKLRLSAGTQAQFGSDIYSVSNSIFEDNISLVFAVPAIGSSSPTERMRINPQGRVSIGTNGTSAMLSIWENASTNEPVRINDTNNTNSHTHRIGFRTGDVEVGKITSDRTSTLYVTSSDYRLKENVAPLIGAIDRLQQIPVHRFNFIADPSKTVDGFLAHEAQAVVPECVIGTKDEVDADGNPIYQGIDQSKLVPLLTAALQEAIAKIETLEASNADLLSRVAALEATP